MSRSEARAGGDAPGPTEGDAPATVGAPATGGAPFFEDLRRGQVFETAPAMTLTAGHAALHQALVGDRLRLALDEELSTAVAGPGGTLAHPLLVTDVAIGQSTVATQRVVANLFYRGLRFHRLPRIGDSLHTACEVVALRANSNRAGRRPTGVAVLRVTTLDQAGRTVLDFHRAAMLPRRSDEAGAGHADSLDEIDAALPPAGELAAAAGLDLAELRRRVPGPHGDAIEAGMTWAPAAGDPVTEAPALARLSLNLAIVHADAVAAGRDRRLVYGGHAIGIAAAQLTRVLPDLVTILAWHSCDHTAPVDEGDVLLTGVEAERVERLEAGGTVAHLRCLVHAREPDGTRRAVLDWRPVALLA